MESPPIQEKLPVENMTFTPSSSTRRGPYLLLNLGLVCYNKKMCWPPAGYGCWGDSRQSGALQLCLGPAEGHWTAVQLVKSYLTACKTGFKKIGFQRWDLLNITSLGVIWGNLHPHKLRIGSVPSFKVTSTLANLCACHRLHHYL